MAGMVVAPQPLAAETGAKILHRGGNAVDAAVAMAFVQGIVDPLMCGLGGWGVMHIYHAQSKTNSVLEFYGRVPSACTPAMFVNDVVGETGLWDAFECRDYINHIGHKSVGLPGTVKGLHHALSNYGTMPWAELLQPAIRAAADGVRVSSDLHNGWRRPAQPGWPDSIAKLTRTLASADIYTRDGRPLAMGELMVHRDAAHTMRRLASDGAAAFYTGDIAREIADDFARNDGLLSADDLRNVHVQRTEPVSTTYRGLTVTSNPPPGSGVTLLEILNILEHYDLKALGHNTPDYIHVLTEAFRAAFADRLDYIGDPEFVDVPVDRLISKAHAAEWQSRIRMDRKMAIEKPSLGQPEPPTTTHLCAVDGEGNVVSLTHTLATGSGVVTPGLGFMYNNTMCLYNVYPGHANSIAPGKMRTTGMVPTVVFKDGVPVITIGAPGGHGIITGVAQVLLNLIDHEMSPLEAVSVPRFHCEHGALEVESRFPNVIRGELAARGHEVKDIHSSYGFHTGIVQVITSDPESGTHRGASDPRRGGIALDPADFNFTSRASS